MSRASQYQPLETDDDEADGVPLPSIKAAGPAAPEQPRLSLWSGVRAELWPNLALLWPMLVSQYLDRASQQVSIMMVGRLGTQQLVRLSLPPAVPACPDRA